MFLFVYTYIHFRIYRKLILSKKVRKSAKNSKKHRKNKKKSRKSQFSYMKMYIEKSCMRGGVLGLFRAHVCGYCSDRPEILTLWRGVLSRSKKSKIKWIGCLSVENEPPTFWGTSIWLISHCFSIEKNNGKPTEIGPNRGPPKCRRLVLHAQRSDSHNFLFFGTAYHSSP